MTLSPMEVRLNNGTTTVSLYLSEGGYDPVPSVDPDVSITESMDIQLRGASLSTIRAAVQQIEQYLIQAANRFRMRSGERIYIEVRFNSSEGWYRSELREGALKLNTDSVEGRLSAGNIPAVLAFTRSGFWEASTEVALPLTSGNGASTTSGINVYNNNDGTGTSPNKKNNYVQIASTDIIGSAPAPIRLEMTNQYNSATRLYNVILAHATHFTTAMASFEAWLQGEAAASGGTTVPNASYSGGNYRNFSTMSTTLAQMGRWTLDTTFLDRAAGRFFKIIAAFTTAPSADIYLQCRLMYPATTPLTVIAESQEVLLDKNRKHQDIGILQLPAWLIEATGSVSLALAIYGRNLTDTSGFALDYLQITPLESYRELNPRGYGAEYTTRLVDDGILGELYLDDGASSSKVGHYTSVGDPIYIRPGKSCRIYFLQTGQTGDIAIDRLLNVKAYYRPRRLSL